MTLVLIWEASTSKAKSKRAGSWKRKKGKAKAKTVIVAKHAKSAPIAPVEWARERGGWVLSSSREETISASVAMRKGIGRGTVPIYLPIKEESDSVRHDLLHDEFYQTGLIFLGYALEMAARLLNVALSNTVAQTLYQIWHDKPTSKKYLRVWDSPAYVKRLVGDKLDSGSSLCRFIGYPKETKGYYFYDLSKQKVFVLRNTVFLERGFSTDTQRDELLLEKSSEAPESNAGTSSAPTISTDNVPILRRSARVPQPLERYGFLSVTGQLDNNPKTYREAMSGHRFGKVS
ncbi:UNVERIFIED_CONTAM: hypothetical protein Scaly_3084600 [Sesamum calycinum]|uniref:Retroviral polymerase SH3-like domain-containing protein n=1 Tax=Sesamum calycinum TaxID=2727403 RepID=A0AAW2JNQ9_9LAMI